MGNRSSSVCFSAGKEVHRTVKICPWRWLLRGRCDDFTSAPTNAACAK
jgi:hypothetical protein